jgi:type I restriction enzyme M protein
LFRDAEADMRRKMIEEDLVECVIGLGPNLFYNSPMEACLLITTTNKPKERKGKILIVNAVKEVKQDKNIAFLEDKHIDKIYKSYLDFVDEEGFSKVIDIETVLENKGSLNIAQYVSNVAKNETRLSLNDAIKNWEDGSKKMRTSMSELFDILK